MEIRGQAGGIVLNTRGRNIVLYCSLMARPGHNSAVANTSRNYRDVGRNTWHYKEKKIPKLRIRCIKEIM